MNLGVETTCQSVHMTHSKMEEKRILHLEKRIIISKRSIPFLSILSFLKIEFIPFFPLGFPFLIPPFYPFLFLFLIHCSFHSFPLFIPLFSTRYSTVFPFDYFLWRTKWQYFEGSWVRIPPLPLTFFWYTTCIPTKIIDQMITTPNHTLPIEFCRVFPNDKNNFVCMKIKVMHDG